MSRSAAIFDIDGTLYRSNLSVELIREYLRQDKAAGNDKSKFFGEYNAWLKSEDRDAYFRTHFIPYYQRLLVGSDDRAFHHAAASVVEHAGEQLLDWSLHELERHKDSGKAIILVSAAPRLVVEPLAKALKADFYWGWDLVFEGGMYIGPVEYSEPLSKLKIIKDIMANNDLTWQGTYGYGDDVSDGPWLEKVEQPTVVNPDSVLEQTAITLEWPIIKIDNLRHYPTAKLIHE